MSNLQRQEEKATSVQQKRMKAQRAFQLAVKSKLVSKDSTGASFSATASMENCAFPNRAPSFHLLQCLVQWSERC